jgi:hypothetical protein
MERNPAQISLAALFIAITALAVALASWNYPDWWSIVVTGAVTAFITALLTSFGIVGGFMLGVVAVFVSCLLVEKDPSGMGPFELILPFNLVVALVPMIVAAAIGRSVRARLSNSS